MQDQVAMRDFEADFPQLDLDKTEGEYSDPETARFFTVYKTAKKRYCKDCLSGPAMGDVWDVEEVQ